MFRAKFSEDIFNAKYRHTGCETWAKLAEVLVDDVCGKLPDTAKNPHNKQLLTDEEMNLLKDFIRDLKFLPGGRYLYYAGRTRKFFNNCYLLRAEEDTREDWANLSWKAESCLMTGGGIGIDYSIYRKSNSILTGTGGFASGPIPKMLMLNEIGRNVMQGGSRRSAIYASLNWRHGDVDKYLTIKNWQDIMVPGTKLTLAEVKQQDQNWPAPLDMTNISVNYDTAWFLQFCQTGDPGDVFRKNVLQAVSTAEPGFSFNFFEQERDTLRNACTEVVSADDSDVCNLGSINLGRISSIEEFKTVLELATKFLLCGTLRADLPYDKVYKVREKNRRLGGTCQWV